MRLLADFLPSRKSDAVVEFVEGDHGVVDDPALRARINDDMDNQGRSTARA